MWAILIIILISLVVIVSFAWLACDVLHDILDEIYSLRNEPKHAYLIIHYVAVHTYCKQECEKSVFYGTIKDLEYYISDKDVVSVTKLD